MIPGSLHPRNLAEFSAERFAAVALARTDRYKAMVLGFQRGQFIPVHAPDVDLLAYVIEGRGYAEIGGSRHELEPGALLVAPRGVARGIYAEGHTVILAFVSPPPGADDHRDVELGLREQRFHPTAARD